MKVHVQVAGVIDRGYEKRLKLMQVGGPDKGKIKEPFELPFDDVQAVLDFEVGERYELSITPLPKVVVKEAKPKKRK